MILTFLEFSSPPFSLGYNNTTKQVTFKYTPNAFATNKFTVAKGIYINIKIKWQEYLEIK